MVFSDGLACFAVVTQAVCVHDLIIAGQRMPRVLPGFKWVNTSLGKPKSTLAGACHSLKCRKYAPFHLAAFAYRFNGYLDQCRLVKSLLVDVVRCPPIQESIVWILGMAPF